ncbi:MAG: hypothetical protein M1834_003111 [Cirrosporium novae-zelandiae]|nr:MAG: hypothetical protein M1834_003111 [Cirrosporium novae-zelandiae]
MTWSSLFLVLGSLAEAHYLPLYPRELTLTTSVTDVPDYFQTETELYPGPTATGQAPLLAETNPAPFGASRTIVPNDPLETAIPISGEPDGANIFTMMGQLTPGFGAQEYPLPSGAEIFQVHMLHRHGSRYPTNGSSVQSFGSRIENATQYYNFTGELSFLNNWSYNLGYDILVPKGRQELFDSGVFHYYQYGGLYNTSSKIIARTTTQDRMMKSAENFMTGFFGLDWTDNATLEVIIEGDYGTGVWNNSLAGYYNCENSNLYQSQGGENASEIWVATYLANATKRFQKLAGGYNWTIQDTYDMQTMCPYETVGYGYSAFCGLFTYSEWQGFEYSIDLDFYGDDGFGSPTGRATGIGYVAEFLARLKHHLITSPVGQDNVTLDNNTVTFPLDQSLYFDFSHDTNIDSVLTAFGLTQFSQYLPLTGPPENQQMVVSHRTPFGARLDIEIIKAPQPVSESRSASSPYISGNATTYVHFILNQRTIPLGRSFSACGSRDDGWCELSAFMSVMKNATEEAQYDYSCNGDYPSEAWGAIQNGRPIS